jgi:hypothetical protein
MHNIVADTHIHVRPCTPRFLPLLAHTHTRANACDKNRCFFDEANLVLRKCGTIYRAGGIELPIMQLERMIYRPTNVRAWCTTPSTINISISTYG